MKTPDSFSDLCARTICGIFFVVLGGCATFPDWMPASGASRQQVQESRESSRVQGIQVVDVNDALARTLAASKKLAQFADIFKTTTSNNYQLGPGDIVELSIWETPPAMLFGATVLDPTSGPITSRSVTLPEQMITQEGTINVPFAGRVRVNGRTPPEIEADIVKRLGGKANQPQVLVRVVKNNTSNITVVGDVTSSTLMPLTPKGERLLDALAIAGGVKQPVNRMSVQLSRGSRSATMPLDAVIRDPRQNILLEPGDVVTALFQSQSFSVLGATGKNDEIPFEAQGISLAQALARSGGLVDSRADARGVFVFRFEDANLVEINDRSVVASNGTVPVVYEINLRDPASFFVTQNFPIQNHDVVYVANSPTTEFEKFLRLLVTVTSPAVTLNRLAQ
ncbi:MAG: polysaccharide export protein [Rhodocyclaceae bacterium]|nr:polysaccharide export protein [Rhodocyclaceae bacterium]